MENLRIPTLKNCKNLKGKKVLLRLDLNVPIKDGEVTDSFRIERSLRTLKFLYDAGAHTVIASHLEDDKGTLEPVAKYLVNIFPRLVFVKDIFSVKAEDEAKRMKDGGFVLFENLRNWSGEKSNDLDFSKRLASFADYFVNDAFSVSHRSHASVVGVPKLLPSCIGFEFEKEIKELSLAFHPEHPFLLIVGGIKFETKLPLIQKFFNIADKIFIGGAIANSFFKSQGLFIGDSAGADSQEIKKFQGAVGSGKIILPVDVRAQSRGFVSVKPPDKISVGEKIWDIGTETEKNLKVLIDEAKFIVWNGPLGYFEEGGVEGNEACAKAIAESKATSIVGGGDTVASIEHLNIMEKMYFVSTGGGAMLDFLANGTLPGIEAIKENFQTQNISWLQKIFS